MTNELTPVFRESQCLNCLWFMESKEDGDSILNFCFAFPIGEGIPDVIWNNEFIHDKMYADEDFRWDHDIRFEWRSE